MATNVIVRDFDPELVKALRERAAEKGVSAEAEHREILKAALFRLKRRPFNEVLMPDVGLDSDFERVRK